MGTRRTVNGKRMSRNLSDAEYQFLRSHDKSEKQFLNACKKIGVTIDPAWLKMVKWIAKTF